MTCVRPLEACYRVHNGNVDAVVSENWIALKHNEASRLGPRYECEGAKESRGGVRPLHM
jgi:hypothetical protein